MHLLTCIYPCLNVDSLKSIKTLLILGVENLVVLFSPRWGLSYHALAVKEVGLMHIIIILLGLQFLQNEQSAKELDLG